jgi:hypothetical protein
MLDGIPLGSSNPSPSGISELSAYWDSDPVTDWDEGFDILL